MVTHIGCMDRQVTLASAQVRVDVSALQLWIAESQSSDKSSQRISCIGLVGDLQNMIPPPSPFPLFIGPR